MWAAFILTKLKPLSALRRNILNSKSIGHSLDNHISTSLGHEMAADSSLELLIADVKLSMTPFVTFLKRKTDTKFEAKHKETDLTIATKLLTAEWI